MTNTNDSFQIETLENAKEYIKALASMVDGAVCLVKVKDNIFSLIEAHDDFYKLFSHTRESFPPSFAQNLILLAKEADRDTLLMKMKAQLQFNNYVEQNIFTCMNHDSLGLWIHFSARQVCIEADGSKIFLCKMKDLTIERQKDESFLYEKERNRILIEQTDDIIFEYDYYLDTLYLSEKWQKLFGYSIPQKDVATNFYGNSSIVYPADKKLFRSLLMGKENKTEHFESKDIRFLKIDGNFIWTRVSVAIIRDDFKRPKRAIGKITNIDSLVQETERLKKDAQRDLLTGLYNQVSIRKLSERAIASSSADSMHALLVVDIDDFKEVNDLYGHAYGDLVLKRLSEILSEVKSEGDYVGRAGGDEFVFFLNNISGMQSAVDMAKQIKELVAAENSTSSDVPSYTTSIGISLYPRDGSDYSKLFETADAALYTAKNAGKDTYEIFHDTNIATLYQSRISEFMSLGMEKVRKPMKYTIAQGIIDILTHASSPNEAIVTAMGLAASYYNISRAVVLEYHSENRGLCDCTYEWVSDEANRLSFEQQYDIPVRPCKVAKEFGTDGVFICSDIKRYKRQGGLFSFFDDRGVTAAFHCGFYDYDRLIGSIGFEVMGGTHEWSMEEVRTLRISCGLIGLYILKHRIEKFGSAHGGEQ